MPEADPAQLARRRPAAQEYCCRGISELVGRAPILVVSLWDLHHPLISRTYVADLDRGFLT